MTTPTITSEEIVERYEAVLIDAYGVLLHDRGALPGAAAFLERLRESSTEFVVVTNDASRSPAACAARYERAGLAIDPARILTSGSLIVPHLQTQNLADVPVCVLGPEGTRSYLTHAGYPLVEPGEDSARALIIGDAFGYDFIEGVDLSLSMLVRALHDGRDVELLCPNPDLIYPSGPDSVGFTAGAIAALFEASLRPKFPASRIHFARLGKPHEALFSRAVELLGTTDVIMLGDQLQTDILGANNFGIDSALMTAGRAVQNVIDHHDIRPTYVMTGVA